MAAVMPSSSEETRGDWSLRKDMCVLSQPPQVMGPVVSVTSEPQLHSVPALAGEKTFVKGSRLWAHPLLSPPSQAQGCVASVTSGGRVSGVTPPQVRGLV